MNKLTALRHGLMIAALALFASQAHAQATRTWVSGVGDDANPCSRTAPCKTFAGAISKTAINGEISVLDPGGFGAVTINKSITIDGRGTLAGILAANTNGVIVNGAGIVVTLRHLSINAAGTTTGNGIRYIQGAELHVENVTISGFLGTGTNGEAIRVEPSAGTGNALFVTNTEITNNTGGVLIAPINPATARATFNGVTLNGNGRGIRAQDGSTVMVRNSQASGNDLNGFVGLAVAGRAVNMTLDNCVSAGNGATGVYSGTLTTVRISNVTVTGNLDGIQMVGGGQIISFGNNRINGNTNSNGPPSSTPGQM